ncbi:MAG TPA: hypothetical protein VFW28_01615 [Micropepsaceae bacterium]|nr:hypothetical protein [Micropepsaceae bacterium]
MLQKLLLPAVAVVLAAGLHHSADAAAAKKFTVTSDDMANGKAMSTGQARYGR